MNYIINYSFIAFVVWLCALLGLKSQARNEIDFNGGLSLSRYKPPIINLIIVSILLSAYSANLAVSGKLADPIRYAWSFSYRYPAYYNSFSSMLNAKTEVGYLLLNMIVKNFTDNPFWLFLVVSFIVSFTNLYIASKIGGKYVHIAFLYVNSMFFFQSTYLIRQALAVAISSIAYIAYLKRSKFKFFILVLIAVLFHASAITIIPAYFVFRRIKKVKHYAYFIAGITLFFLLFEFVMQKFVYSIPFLNQYIDPEYFLTVSSGTILNTFKGIPFYLLTIIALIKRESLIKTMYQADFFIICSVLYSISWILSYKMYWFFRVGWYFLLPTLILLHDLPKTFSNNKVRVIYYILMVILLVLITYRQIYITLN